MHIVEERSADALLGEAHAFLTLREVENSSVLATLQALRDGLYREPAPWLWSVRDGASLVGVVLRTPPQALLLSTMPPAACAALADALVARALLPLELNGMRAEVDGVVAGLSSAAPVALDVITELRLFDLRQVIPAPSTPGAMRAVGAADEALLVSMLSAFMREALPREVGQRDLSERVARMLAHGAAFFWEDDARVEARPRARERRVVALAAVVRRVGRGASVSWVYTPPALRGRGYATALVAALSQHLLDTGLAYTNLFTDQANPTSNSIYQKVGYRVVNDARHVSVAWK